MLVMLVPCCSLKECRSKDAQAARRCNAAGRSRKVRVRRGRQAWMQAAASSYRAVAVAVRRHSGSYSSGGGTGMGMGTRWGMGCGVTVVDHVSRLL